MRKIWATFIDIWRFLTGHTGYELQAFGTHVDEDVLWIVVVLAFPAMRHNILFSRLPRQVQWHSDWMFQVTLAFFCLYSALSSIKILFLLFGRSGCSFPSSQDTHGLAIQLKPNKIALGMFFIQMVSFGAHKSSLIQRCQMFFPSKCFCHNKKN